MPNLGIEFHFWWFVWILRGELNINLKDTTFVRSTLWAFDRSFPVPKIIIDYSDFDVGFLGLNSIEIVTVFAKSSNYFFMRISFFCIASYVQIKYYNIRFINPFIFLFCKTVFFHFLFIYLITIISHCFVLFLSKFLLAKLILIN